MRHYYNKRPERQILVPRRPEKEERKEIKRIDLRLKRKEEHRVTHISCGYFRNFGDQIPQDRKNRKNPVHRPKHRWKPVKMPNQHAI